MPDSTLPGMIDSFMSAKACPPLSGSIQDLLDLEQFLVKMEGEKGELALHKEGESMAKWLRK